MRDADTVATLFDLAISLETILRALYRKFAQRFAHVPEASRLWEAMGKDEMWHAQKLEAIRDSLSVDELHGEANARMLHAARWLVRLSVDDALKTVRTLQDAYELAHELEHSEVNAIFGFLASEFIPSEAQRRFVRAEIRNHLDRLARCPEVVADPAKRSAVHAKAA